MTRAAPLADDTTDTASRGLILVMAAASAVVVANLYYVQPIVGILSRAYGLPVALSGLLVTVTQLGYATGLVLIVPLGDIVENRRLILVTLGLLVVALAAAVVAPDASLFLAASLAIGVAASTVQVIVPFAGHLAPERTRGRVVGTVVSGLLLGVMLSRPAASFAAHLAGPRSIFALSAAAVAAVAAILAWRLPVRRPRGMPYFAVLASLGPLLRDTPVLQRRAAYQAAMFGAFSLFWTASPLLLEGPSFRFTQIGIGVFALVGAGGAIASPFAGRAADAGHTRLLTGSALAAAAASFPAAFVGYAQHSIVVLVAAAIVLDAATAVTLVTGQRAIFALGAEARGRLNGLFLALFFLGGAAGSFVASIAYAHGGWGAACLVGLAFPASALAYWTTDRDAPPR